MITDYDNPTNDPFMPYRCPICFNPISPYLWSADGKRKSCGCFTMSCDAPIFEQKNNESKFIPLIEWNKWVINYRKEHPNYHREFMCKGCELEGVSCDFYDENTLHCHFWRSKEEDYVK